MSQTTTALTLGHITIRQLDGLFSLNDLHKASGGAEKHRPNQFIRNEQTQALIAELSNAQIRAFESRKGSGGGTYACRELVIAYAAWISPAFHLRVIRVFLNAATPPAVAEPPRLRMVTLMPGQMVVDRAKLVTIWSDLGKLRDRVDALGMREDDLPPAWWQGKAISR